MSTKYFDKWEFQQILSLMETNPLEAKIRFEEYLKKYPKDYLTYPYYASILIKLRQLDAAEKILDYVKYVSSIDHKYANELNKLELLKNNIFYTRLRLLAYQEKYSELYQLCLCNRQYIKMMNLCHFDFYCRKKNGMIVSSIRDTNSYLFRQIVEYRESDFLQHINKHLADYNKDGDKPNKNIFSSNFPIDEILREIKKYIPSEKGLFNGFYDDVYTFKYNGCGRDNNKSADYFKVVCFHNTMDFITMFPVSDCQNLPYIDLNYLVFDKKNSKVRKKSQIDKFNKKYGFN